MAENDKHAFIGTSPCGCVSSIAVDNGREGREVWGWIMDGAAVVRLPLDEAKRRFTADDCPHTPKWGRSQE